MVVRADRHQDERACDQCGLRGGCRERHRPRISPANSDAEIAVRAGSRDCRR
jgi:hypothetical protein